MLGWKRSTRVPQVACDNAVICSVIVNTQYRAILPHDDTDISISTSTNTKCVKVCEEERLKPKLKACRRFRIHPPPSPPRRDVVRNQRKPNNLHFQPQTKYTLPRGPPTMASNAGASSFLTSLLNKNLRIYTTDTRIFVGQMKCTDKVHQPTLSHLFHQIG